MLTVKTRVVFDLQAYESRVALLLSGVTQGVTLWIGSKLPRVLHLTYRSNPSRSIDCIEIIQT
jgi:hypothetical protein